MRRTAVVLLHGLCSTPDELLTVQSALRTRGYSVHPMRVGGYSFDASSPVQRALPYERWIDAIEARVKVLRTEHERVMLVGISAGPCRARRCCCRWPSTRRSGDSGNTANARPTA